VRCVGALLCGALVVGCAPGERREPAAAPAEVRPATAPQTILVTPGPGVAEAQPPPPALTALQTPPPVVTPPAGAEEAQPRLSTLPDARQRTEQVVAIATRQIDRLQRMERATPALRHRSVDTTLGVLTTGREKVMQDLRELELEPPTRTSAIRSELNHDLNALQKAVTATYATAPPPGPGLPHPSPRRPSQLPGSAP